jgi:hypothetical protein
VKAQSCAVAHIVAAEDGDTLCCVVIASQYDKERLLDLVIEAAKRSEGWAHTTASRLLSVSIGDDVIGIPVDLTIATGEAVWRECRGAFLGETQAVAP